METQEPKTPCNDEALRNELIERILLINEKYDKALVERAIDSCCSYEKNDIEGCVVTTTRQFFLNKTM